MKPRLAHTYAYVMFHIGFLLEYGLVNRLKSSAWRIPIKIWLGNKLKSKPLRLVFMAFVRTVRMKSAWSSSVRECGIHTTPDELAEVLTINWSANSVCSRDSSGWEIEPYPFQVEAQILYTLYLCNL